MSRVSRERPTVQPDPSLPVAYATPFEPPDEDLAWVAQHLGYPEGEPADEPRLPFAEWVRLKASEVRLADTAAARWLADEIDELADLAERLGAHTPDEFTGRYEVMETSRSEDLVQAGYVRGYDAALSDAQEFPDVRFPRVSRN